MKLWKFMLAASLVLVVLLAFAACGGCEHVYGSSLTTKPTCTDSGINTFTCALCGESYIEVVEASGHNYKAKEPVEPTCVKEGYVTYVCVCGDMYRETTESATGHNYAAAVTPATCSTEGYTTYTCNVCGDSMKDDFTAKNDKHVFKTSVGALTDEQAADNPYAMGVEILTCEQCGHVENSGKAILVYMDFDKLINNVKDYDAVASENYKQAVVASQGAMSINVQKALILFDEQKNIDVFEGWGKSSQILTQDGKLKMTQLDFYVYDLLNLCAKQPVISEVSISFDYIVNRDPKKYDKLDYCPIFAMTTYAGDTQFYNNRPIILALDKADQDPNPLDEVYAYDLIIKGFEWGILKQDANTGYRITLGKEYSFRIDLDGSYSFTLWVKAADELEYTKCGTYDYPAHDRNSSMFMFSNGYNNTAGNLLDNFKITTPLQ